jgi:hypothetical protein
MMKNKPQGIKTPISDLFCPYATFKMCIYKCVCVVAPKAPLWGKNIAVVHYSFNF